MGIRTKNCEEFTPLREQHGRFITVPVPVNVANNVVASATPPAVGSGHTIATARLVPTTLLFSMASSTGSVTYLISGFNQFGEPVSEVVTLTGAASTDDEVTLNAFLVVTSIVVTAKSGTPGAVVVGQNTNNAVLLSLGAPLKCQQADVETFQVHTGAVQASSAYNATYNTMPFAAGVNVTVPSLGYLHLRKHAWLKY